MTIGEPGMLSKPQTSRRRRQCSPSLQRPSNPRKCQRGCTTADQSGQGAHEARRGERLLAHSLIGGHTKSGKVSELNSPNIVAI